MNNPNMPKAAATQQPTPDDLADLLTPEQAAGKLKVSANTLASWRSTGRHALPFVKMGSRVYYRRADVRAHLEAMRRSQPAAASVHPIRPAGPSAVALDPADTLIRIPDVLAMTGLGGRSSLYKMLKADPTFPRPVPLSASTARGAPVAFVLGEVQAWVRGRIAARGEVAA